MTYFEQVLVNTAHDHDFQITENARTIVMRKNYDTGSAASAKLEITGDDLSATVSIEILNADDVDFEMINARIDFNSLDFLLERFDSYYNE